MRPRPSTGVIGETATIPSSDWAWAKCSATNPFPGTPDPTQICLKNGFDPKLLYQVVFTAKDPYVLGIGFAAFRDVASFFKYATQDDEGTPNPLAQARISWVISAGRVAVGQLPAGVSAPRLQPGRSRAAGVRRRVADHRRPAHRPEFPLCHARRRAEALRAGSEGPQWWVPWPDPVRGLPATGILDRCTASNTCPKIIEHFGAAEVWGLKLTPEWVGTTADKDIPLPANVRRYYIPSTQHGGGERRLQRRLRLRCPRSCPGTNFGAGIFAANPVPHTETVNALRVHFRNWVMKDTPPPPSRYPTLAQDEATWSMPTKEAMGFPTIPGVPPSAPTGLINPVLDYDWGPTSTTSTASGVPTKVPPEDQAGDQNDGAARGCRRQRAGRRAGRAARRAARHVSRLEHHGRTAFHKGKICNYAGGMIPFAKTKAERMANGDPRLSLEERYRTHEGTSRR